MAKVSLLQITFMGRAVLHDKGKIWFFFTGNTCTSRKLVSNISCINLHLQLQAKLDDKEYPSVPHRRPQFNTRITPFQRPKSLSSTQKTPHFNPENPSVQHFLSSTSKTPQFNTKKPLSSTHSSVRHQKRLSSLFWCWTEGFLGAEKEWPLCSVARIC